MIIALDKFYNYGIYIPSIYWSYSEIKYFLFVWALQRYTAYNATHLSGIVHQKGWLNFLNVLVSDRKHIFLNKNLTTQIKHVGLSKIVLTSKIRLYVPTQHTEMFGTYTFFY